VTKLGTKRKLVGVSRFGAAAKAKVKKKTVLTSVIQRGNTKDFPDVLLLSKGREGKDREAKKKGRKTSR